MSASDGCYDADTGFDPAATGSVADAPELGERPDPAAGVEGAYAQDDASVLALEWVGLEQHSADVRDAALALMDEIRPALTPVAREAVAVAAHAHDAGKSHATWQDALCQLASPEDRERINAGRPWAKSDRRGRLRFVGGVTFRHELASLLLLDGPLQGLLHGAADPDLVRYLVLAHHGKLRVQVRAPENGDEKVLLGLKDGAVVATSALLGQPAGEMTIDIGQFELGGERSWTRTALRLRDRYGPFLLTYLETLVRIADWRASGPALEAPREPKDAR